MHLRAEFGPALWKDPAHMKLLGSCSLVIGMHPDQVKRDRISIAMSVFRSGDADFRSGGMSI